MATFVATHLSSQALASARPPHDRRFALLLVNALTLFTFAVNGYHPYADDGGLYMAGVKRLLNPNLYPHSTAFVLEPMRFSLFAPAVAAIVRLVPLPSSSLPHSTASPFVLLGLHLATLWMTLFGAWMLASRCWPDREARTGAVALLACWLGLPVAGTALTLMDPYLTARSLSTPCMVLALVGALDMTEPDQPRYGIRRRGLVLWLGSILLAAAMHPLMASYAFGASLLLIVTRASQARIRIWGCLALSAAALLLATVLQAAATPESSDYLHIAMTRTYWFIAQWQWYELFGLAAPLAILAYYAIRYTDLDANVQPAACSLARTSIVAGLTAILVALLFARAGAPTHLLSRMQPLRVFQIVYLVTVLILGAKLEESLLRRSAWRWGLAVVVLAGPMLGAARASYPHSPHIEAPWVKTQNPWVRAFEWIRHNTPTDALFALDADYINAAGEDAQCFRAIAERSALADYSKDGGEASIAPALTEEWVRDQQAQTGMDARATTDPQRLEALQPLGVSWVVLGPAATTKFDCPYRNEAVAVCRLP